MLGAEHTWGWNGGDIRHKSWTNAELAASLKSDEQFSTAVLTWREQRAATRNARAALPRGGFASLAQLLRYAEEEGIDGRHRRKAR